MPSPISASADVCDEQSFEMDGQAPATAQVVGSFGNGGAQRVAYNLGVGLRSIGVKSIGVAVRRPGTYAATDAGMPIVSLDVGDGGSWRTLRAMGRLRRLIRAHQIDLVHVHGSASLPFCVLAMTGMRHRPRLWFTWHDSGSSPLGRGMSGRLLRWSIRNCDRIFGASQQIASTLQTIPGLRARVSVFRNGVPATSRRCELADEPLILWMGRIVPDKDPQILIRVAARLMNEGLRFRVVIAGNPHRGGSEFFDECKQLVQRLKLDGVVSFPGWVEDTSALICSASIGVQTSLSEGLSMTVLEMMMAGLAVVATDVGDTREAVRQGAGILIPPNDEQRLYDALRAMLMDSELRKRSGDQAEKLALAEFSTAAMAARVRREYSLSTSNSIAAANAEMVSQQI